MKFQEKKVSSTSSQSADVDPIVLRDKSTTRLVFKPTMVENRKNPKASIKGTFIYQRKGKNDEWEDLNEVKLNELKSGEGINLTLKSAELLKFIKELIALYKLYQKEGIKYGEVSYIKAESDLTDLSNVSDEDFKKFLDLNTSAGINIFNRFLNWVTNTNDKDLIVKKLQKLESHDLNTLNSIINLSGLINAIKVWKENKSNGDEEFWQQKFLRYPFLLNSLFNFPVLLIDQKAYVGGKQISNKDGNIVDFLAQKEMTKNAILIEIKTPTTPLLSNQYRKNAYNINKELSGSIIQILNYKQSLIEHSHFLKNNTATDFDVVHPTCMIIAGNTDELDNKYKTRSFELFRNSLTGIQIITYDELFQKVHNLAGIIQS